MTKITFFKIVWKISAMSFLRNWRLSLVSKRYSRCIGIRLSLPFGKWSHQLHQSKNHLDKTYSHLRWSSLNSSKRMQPHRAYQAILHIQANPISPVIILALVKVLILKKKCPSFKKRQKLHYHQKNQKNLKANILIFQNLIRNRWSHRFKLQR